MARIHPPRGATRLALVVVSCLLPSVALGQPASSRRVLWSLLQQHAHDARSAPPRCHDAVEALSAAARAGDRDLGLERLRQLQACVGETSRLAHAWGSEGGALDLGPIVSRVPAVPAILGGTLAVAPDGALAVAADPDRDLVHVVDLRARAVRATLRMRPGDEPGRVVLGAGDLAHVVLRRAGELATLDTRTGLLRARRAVCASPRGAALGTDGSIHVACAGGQLVTLPEHGAGPERTRSLDGDLRDVLEVDGRLVVSRLRSAELLTVAPGGAVTTARPPGNLAPARGRGFSAAVAWRILPSAAGAVVMSHQLASDQPVSLETGGYGGPVGAGEPIVRTAVTVFGRGAPSIVVVEDAPLPVDLVLSADGHRAVIVAAGNHRRPGAAGQVFEILLPRSGFATVAPRPLLDAADPHQVVAAAGTPDDLVLQSREPAALLVGGAWLPLAETSAHDAGHAMFHLATAAGLACASCHPEGADDGRVWTFDRVGRRRTQPLDVGVIGTEPFHWDGDLADLSALVDEVYVRRMSGTAPAPSQVDALSLWLDGMSPPPAPATGDHAAVARGRALFADGRVGCAACHSGPRFTSGASVDVGTGGRFQVPSLLGLSSRGVYMHDGCADDLLGRFDRRCGGARHGDVSHLPASGVDDLVSYLRTL